MMLRMLINITRGDLTLEKDKEYKIEDIIQGEYKIKAPMKQKGKFRFALVKDEEGVLL